MGNAQYQYTLQSENLDDLNQGAPKVLAKLRKLPQLKDLNPTNRIAASRPR